MSSKSEDDRALFARRMERAGDNRRMTTARRDVVSRARAEVLADNDQNHEPANDPDPKA